METYLNYINGEWIHSIRGKTAYSMNPANGENLGAFQDSDPEDMDLAVAAAVEAKLRWRSLSGSTRGNLLFKTANIIEQRLDEIAETMTREMGKTLAEARGETARGVAILRYYAGEGMRKVGDVIPSIDENAFLYTTRMPLGVVGVITPWNFPIAIPLWKMAPGLIYGNTVVLKPSELTTITAVKMMECLHEAGFPSGVINLVAGMGASAGQRLVDHTDVNGITFTGSNRTGKRIGAAVLARGGKYQLEMGGKNPIIIASDADLDLAVDATISGGIRSTGQKCTATSRVFVHEDIYEAFRERLLDQVGSIIVGDGLHAGTWMGPCASETQLDTVLSYIRKGVEEGAVLAYGGKRLDSVPHRQGFFVEPTIFEQVSKNMTIAKEEIFGPVLALMKVSSLEEAVELANDTDFGLSASIFTKDIKNVFDFINGIEAGLVRVNSETAGVELQAPFGGMKQSSSHSREQGQAAIEFFTSVKTVFIKP
jgi:aldehyde dehydrogenase (NAD+)